MGILSKIGDALNISESVFFPDKPTRGEVKRVFDAAGIHSHGYAVYPPTLRCPRFYITACAVERGRKREALAALHAAGIKANGQYR